MRQQTNTSYDKLGRVVSAKSVNANGDTEEESYTYDGFGRLKSVTSPDGSVQNYTYDNNSNVTGYELVEDGTVKNSITYQYNGLNQLTGLANNGITTTYGYDGNGNLLQKSSTNGLRTSYEYNKANLMTSMENNVGTDIQCNYLLNGYISLVTRPIEGQSDPEITTYSYDRAGRLKSENVLEGGMDYTHLNSYTYDAFGNRKTATKREYGNSTVTTNYSYDLNNRLVEEITGNISVTYSYDNNGNTIEKCDSNYNDNVYSYDAFNRLISYDYNNGSYEASYTYNANNLRASKTVNGSKTTFAWDGQNLAAENTGNETNTYTYDVTGVHIYNMNGSAGTYVKDHHGNIIGGRSKSGTMFADKDNCMEYDAFGNKRNKNIPAPFGYCGEYTDAESGLVYLRNRYYDTTTGRFITEDPAKDGLNWYSYCANNPVVLVDPSGLSSVPRDLDWDEDGKIDSKADRQRFDSDNNGIADWNESRTYIAPKEWYRYESSNILNNFKHVDQDDYNLCWAACISMSVGHLTKSDMDVIQIATDNYGEDFNKGKGGPIGQARFIDQQGYLQGSGYEVNENAYNGGYIYNQVNNRDKNPLKFEDIIQQIDSQIPLIISAPHEKNHVVVIVGYAYNKETNEQMVLYDNPNQQTYYRELDDFKNTKGKTAITFTKIN